MSRFGSRTDEEQREDDDELIDSVSQDVLGHGAGDERLVATVRLPLQQRLSGRFRCQSQGCKRVHDQVHPQHLHRLQGRVLVEKGAGELTGREDRWLPF